MKGVSNTSLVERLRARLQRDRRGNFDPELSIKLGPGVYEEVQEAAETIERLTRELERVHANPGDFRYWEGRYRDEKVRALTAEAQRDGLLALLIRYRNETPLGNQPHMTAHEADEAIAAIRAARLKPDQEETPLTKPKSSQNVLHGD